MHMSVSRRGGYLDGNADGAGNPTCGMCEYMCACLCVGVVTRECAYLWVCVGWYNIVCRLYALPLIFFSLKWRGGFNI